MAAFTADSINISNGRDVAEVISQEAINTIQKGDFLVISGFPPVEILQAYKNGQGERFIELLKPWPHTSQSNQPAIVIPTTVDYREAVEALRAANTLVSDNKKAMSDWQTNMGTVTFKDKDGNDVVVKTLRQIEADNQAQMNAYHPYPWAMRKVEFEAMRAANNEKFAASGFVHFGKEYAAALENVINQGMYVNPASALAERAKVLHLGRNASSNTGESKTDSPFINIAGVVTELLGADLGYTTSPWDRDSFIVTPPPAEDGTRTYDSATGVSVTHATPALAFAAETATNKVVTDREDVWGIYQEVREINEEYPFVYKNGLPQSLASDIDGVPTVSNNVQGITYFAQYDGDISSRGRGVNWLTATEEERRTIASNPKNKIKFDDQTGKFYQTHNFAITFRGIGNGSWQFVDVQNTATLRFDLKTPVTNSDGSYFTGYNNAKYNKEYIGVYQKVKGNDPVEDSYLLLCGTVNRRNIGLYHDSFNKLGTAKASDDKEWHNTAQSFTSKADCFDPAKLLTNSGSIASGKSGAPDGRYYDAIYASGLGGVCRDMRYSAWDLTAEDFAEQDLAIKSGEYRGRERLPFSVPIVVGANSLTTYISLGSTKPKWWDDSKFGTGTGVNKNVSDMFLINPSTGEKLYVAVTGYTESSNLGWYLRVSKTQHIINTSQFNSLSADDVLILQTQGNESLCKTSSAGEYTHTEVIGDPANILLCDDLKEGWVGSWNGFVPDGVKQWSEVKLSKPTSDTLTTSLYTDSDGATWSTASFVIDPAKNTLDSTGTPPQGRVEILNYKTTAKATVAAVNAEVYDKRVGTVWATSFYARTWGTALAYSCTGKILTNSVSTGLINSSFTVTKFSLRPITGVLDSNTGREPTHAPITLSNVSDNLGFKALNYNVAENQQGFINYAYAQLTYDATAGDWGDDGKIHIADNQTTMLDENGHINLVGTARCVEPLGWIKNDK